MSEQTTGVDDLTCTTWVGNHPDDGEPVACWVTHPDHAEHGGQADQFATAIGAPRHDPGFPVVVLDPEVVTVVVDQVDGWATLTLWGQPVARIGCVADWCDVARARGWVLVVVTPHTPPHL
ncbi:MAG TPA: hypothetical protein VGK35_08980, partial [Actinotalea sp.]